MLPTTSTEEPPPRARQLRLFPPPKPLAERLGREFFLKLPRVPGVYFMYDGAGTLLYIGQSQDLRDRLSSYRHVHPDRDPRRIVRLVHVVERIEWRELESAERAIQTEKELLLKHRPRFNRASVWPAPKWYIELQREGSRLTLRLLKDPESGEGKYGPFKGSCRRAYAALVRFTYMALIQPESFAQVPNRLLTQPCEKGFSIRVAEGRGAFLELLASGLAEPGEAMVKNCEAVLTVTRCDTAFEKAYWECELKVLREFFCPELARKAETAATTRAPVP